MGVPPVIEPMGVFAKFGAVFKAAYSYATIGAGIRVSFKLYHSYSDFINSNIV